MTERTYQLFVQKGPEPGKIYVLSKDSMVVGRDPNSEIVIEDLEVSRQHARFLRVGDAYELQDMGSTNGSFVGGDRLGGDPVKLSAGDMVMFGSNVEIVYQVIVDIDPMATMISPNINAMMAEMEAEAASEPEPVAEPEPDPLPEFDIDAMPSFDDEPEADPLPSFDDDLPVFEAEPEADPFPPVIEEDPGLATMIDPAPAGMDMMDDASDDLPSFDEPDPFPSFDAEPEPEPVSDPFAAFDEPEPAPLMQTDDPPALPSFDDAPSSDSKMPSMADADGGGGFFSNRRNVTIAAVGGALLICCCLAAIAAAVAYSQGMF